MTPQSLKRLDLLAAAKEAVLLEQIGKHSLAVQRHEEQLSMLEAYQTRLAAGWQSGSVVPAGEALRAGQFSAQAMAAMTQLEQVMQTDQGRLMEAALALARLRAHRRNLQKTLKRKLREEAERAEERARQNQPVPRRHSFRLPVEATRQSQTIA